VGAGGPDQEAAPDLDDRPVARDSRWLPLQRQQGGEGAGAGVHSHPRDDCGGHCLVQGV